LPKADKERGKHQLFETVHYHHLINKTPPTSFLIDFREKICFFCETRNLVRWTWTSKISGGNV